MKIGLVKERVNKMNKEQMDNYIEAIGKGLFPKHKEDNPFTSCQLETIRLNLIVVKESHDLSSEMVLYMSEYIKEQQRKMRSE